MTHDEPPINVALQIAYDAEGTPHFTLRPLEQILRLQTAQLDMLWGELLAATARHVGAMCRAVFDQTTATMDNAPADWTGEDLAQAIGKVIVAALAQPPPPCGPGKHTRIPVQ